MPTSSWTLDSKHLEQVACPVCHSIEFERLAATDRYDMGIITAGCIGCGLVMTNPQPTAGTLDDFYAHHYRRYYQSSESPTLEYLRALSNDKRSAATIDFLIAHGDLVPDMVVLDIGAAEGSMLKAVGDRLPATRRIAIEPNPAFGRFAVQHAGCEWHANLQAFSHSRPPVVDLVIINHVLEHLKNPVQFLESLRPLLAGDAHIYVDVPDLLAYRKLKSLHIAHLYHFGPDSLRKTAEHAGFSVRLMETHGPAKHPRSLRCLLSADADVPVDPVESAPVNPREGWQQIADCTRHAWFAHGKRWLRSTAANGADSVSALLGRR